MKKFFTILSLIFFIASFAKGQTISCISPDKTNYPTFENDVFYFDDDFSALNLNSNSLILSVNSVQTQIDSILIQNSSIADTLELLIGIELTAALNSEDKLLIKDFLNYLQNLNSKRQIFVSVLFFNDNQILICDRNNFKLSFLDDLLASRFYKKPDVNNLIKSDFLKQFITSKYFKTLMLIGKSSPKLDVDLLSKFISDNSINFLNFNLSGIKKDKYEELSSRTQSYYYNISDFSNSKNFFNTSIFLSLNGKPNKIFWDKPLPPSTNKIELSYLTQSDSMSFPVFLSDIPQLDFPNHNEFFGIIDSGFSVNKSIRISAKNKPINIKEIKVDNPDYIILNSTSEIELNPNSYFDLKIQFDSKSSNFSHSVLSLTTNSYFTYKINLYAGNRPKTSETKINFQQPLAKDTLYTSELYHIIWDGTFPFDTFKIDYKYALDTAWNNITNNAASNEYIWKVPDNLADKIDLKISQVSSSLVSDKVIQLIGHKKRITNVSWSPNDSLIATSSEDGKILLWDRRTGNQIKTLFQSQTKIIADIDWSSDGKFIAISASDTVLKIWNVNTDVLQTELKAPYEIDKIKFTKNDESIIGVLKNGQIIVWDFNSGKPLQLINSGSNLITSFELNPVLSYFVIGTSDGRVTLWDYSTGKLVKEITVLQFPILSLNFSPGGNNLAISSIENKIRIFDITTGINVLTIFDVNSPILSINWLSNKQFIASSLGNTIKLWNPSDGSLNNIYDQHSSNVILIKSSHNGNFISSVEENNIVHIWSPFDFPFIRPEVLSKKIENLQVLTKKLSIVDLILPPVQKGDTLYYYDNDFCKNISKFSVVIDTVFQTSTFKKISLISPNEPANLESDKYLNSEIEIIPSDTMIYNSNEFIKSGYKTYIKLISGFVPNRFFDKKISSVDFGTLELDSSKDSSFFALQNIGSSPFTIDSIKFLSFDDKAFALINPNIPYTMQPTGGALVPKVKFTPQKIGINSAILRIFFKNSQAVDIQLLGNGTAPLLVSDSSVDAGNLLCENFKQFQVPFYNKGNSILKILDFTKNNDFKNEISKIEFSKNEILPGDSSLIKIDLSPKEIGKKVIDLQINTNKQSNLKNLSSISFSFIKDSLNLIPDSLFLKFNPQSEIDRVQKILRIKNSGNFLPELSILSGPKYFSLDSIKSNTSEVFIYITFIGGLNLTNYSDSLVFSDNCNKKFKLDLLASINNPKPVLNITDKIDFGKLLCENTRNSELLLKNIGFSTLTIDKVYLKQNRIEFQIPIIQNLNIMPDSAYSISISFYSNLSGIYTDTLVFETNASNFQNGIVQIPLISEKIYFVYSFSSKSFLVENLGTNTSDTLSFYFVNKSPIPIKLDFKNLNTKFKYIYPEKSELNPDDSLKIEAIFEGADTSGVFEDEFIFTDECGTTQRVLMEVFVNSNTSEIFEISPVYPNPSFTFFNVKIKSNIAYNYQYRIFDEAGKLVYNSTVNLDKKGIENIQVNLTDYSIGVYYLEINTSRGKIIRKLIKLK